MKVDLLRDYAVDVTKLKKSEPKLYEEGKVKRREHGSI